MTKCLIIGSGIVGLSTAYELNNQGYEITIIDNNKTGQASKSSGGILFPLNPWKNSKFMQDLCISGHSEYNNFFNSLGLRDREEIGYKKSNIIMFGKNLKYAKEWYKKNNFISSEYCKNKLSLIEKNVKDMHKDYLLIKNINLINPNFLIDFYKRKLLYSGVVFKKDNIKNLYDYIKISENNIYDFIIVAAGSWSNEILQRKDISLKPIKGQLLYFRTKSKLINNVLLFDDYYVIPRRGNNVVVGSTIEDVGYENNITEEAKDYLKKSLLKIFKSDIDMKDMKYSFGFRPFSINDKPYICRDNNNKRIIYNFGHYRYGILTSISSAKIVSGYIS
tara:strand:- start:121 stop:1122 length:1002 start_codon:yes stop_codon:yes gene_type:complete